MADNTDGLNLNRSELVPVEVKEGISLKKFSELSGSKIKLLKHRKQIKYLI